MHALERIVLGFVGIAPVHETLIGMADGSAPTSMHAGSKLRALGRTAA